MKYVTEMNSSQLAAHCRTRHSREWFAVFSVQEPVVNGKKFRRPANDNTSTTKCALINKIYQILKRTAFY